MTYTLDAFVKDAKAALAADNSPAGREQVRVLLEKLLANQQFVDEAVGPAAPMGTRKLYEDKDLGFVVLAHVNPKPHKSPPHDHGSSWAVYGQAVKYTDMSEYKRLDGGNDAGEAKLEKVKMLSPRARPCRRLRRGRHARHRLSRGQPLRAGHRPRPRPCAAAEIRHGRRQGDHHRERLRQPLILELSSLCEAWGGGAERAEGS